MLGNNKIWINRGWRQFWSRPSLKGSHRSAAFSWNIITNAKARSERFMAWLQKRDYPHYGPQSKIPELFYRRDLNFFALHSGRLHFDKALRPMNCYDLLDAAATVGALETRLGYTFKDRMLCLQALKATDSHIPLYWKGTMFELVKNKRLALVGDRALALTVCMIWYRTEHSNKSYSIMEAATLSRVALAVTARKIRLHEALLCQPGSEDHDKDHLAEGFEAVIGAVYVDSNEDLTAVKKVVQNLKLDQHRNLKSWEEMTKKERKQTGAENSEAVKRQGARGGESGTDYIPATAKRLVSPSSYAPTLEAYKTKQPAQMTVDRPAKPSVAEAQPPGQVVDEGPDLQELYRLLQDLPVRRHRNAFLQLRHVINVTKGDNPLAKKAANLALERYAGLLKEGNQKASNTLQTIYQDLLRQSRMSDYTHKNDRDPAHATVIEKKGPLLKTEDEDKDLRMADEEPEVHTDQEEDKVWEAAGQEETESDQKENRAHKLEEGTSMREAEEQVNPEMAKTGGLVESEEEEEKQVLLWLKRHTGKWTYRLRLPSARKKEQEYKMRLAEIQDARARKLDHPSKEELVAIKKGENSGKVVTVDQQISPTRNTVEEEGTRKVRNEDKTHEMEEETKLGVLETERSKREEEEEEEKRLILWLEEDQKSGNSSKHTWRKSKLSRRRRRILARLVGIREARAQDDILSEEAQESEELVASEEDTKARIAAEINIGHIESEEMMLRSKQEEESRQPAKYTAVERDRILAWKRMFLFGHLSSSLEGLPGTRTKYRFLEIELEVSEQTAELMLMAELRRPQGWPTPDHLQHYVAATIISPYKRSHCTLRQGSRLEFRPLKKYRHCIAKAISQGLRLGSTEWNQYVKATFHRASKMELVIGIMEREGHVAHWKEEFPDRSQQLFVETWELATDAGTSASDFVRQFDEDNADASGVYPTTKLAIRAYAALERKLMDKTASSDPETTPWEEAVREAVQDQEEKSVRVAEKEASRAMVEDNIPEFEKEETGSADEDIMRMLEAERSRVTETEEKQKSHKIGMLEAETSRVTEAEEKQKSDMEQLELVKMVALEMRRWKAKLIDDHNTSYGENVAASSGRAVVQKLSAPSRINVRSRSLREGQVKLTKDMIALPILSRFGDWSLYPPVTLEHLLNQAKGYCRPNRADILTSLGRRRYLYAIRYAIVQDSRIGSKEWNEVVEASFRRSLLIEMSFRHLEFSPTPELQSTALDMERQFSKQIADILRESTTRTKHQTWVHPNHWRSLQKTAFGGTLPSKKYRELHGRRILPPNSVSTGVLRMIGTETTDSIKPSLPASSASAQRVPIFGIAGSAATFDMDESDSQSSRAASRTGYIDALPTTGTLVIVCRAGKVTNERAAPRSKQATKPEDQQPVVSSTMVTDPLMESEQGREHASQQPVVSSALVTDPLTESEHGGKHDNQQLAVSDATVTDHLTQSEQQRNSAEKPSSLKRIPRASGIIHKVSCKDTPRRLKASVRPPSFSNSATKNGEPDTTVGTVVSTFRARRQGKAKAKMASTQAPASSKTASTKAEPRRRVATSISKSSRRVNNRLVIHKTSTRGPNQTSRSSPSPKAAPRSAESSPRPLKMIPTFRSFKKKQPANQSSDAQAETTATSKTSTKSSVKVSSIGAPVHAPAETTSPSANAHQRDPLPIRRVTARGRRMRLI